MIARKARRFACVLLLLITALTGGCHVVNWLIAALAPPEPVPAVYEPPRNKVVLVFVDDLLHNLDYEPVKSDLTEKLNKLLLKNKIAGEVISYEELQQLIFSTPGFNRLAVSEVGQRLGAEIVLYVQIDGFALKDDEASPLWNGRFKTTVRMVDVKTGRLWPLDRQEGYPVPELELPAKTDSSPNYGATLANQLARKMAERIGQLFYEHGKPIQPRPSWRDEEEAEG